MNDYLNSMSSVQSTEGSDQSAGHKENTDMEMEDGRQVKNLDICPPQSTSTGEPHLDENNFIEEISYGQPKKVSVRKYVLFKK